MSIAKRPLRSLPLAIALTITVIALTPSPAVATVYEIGDDGSVRTSRSGRAAGDPSVPDNAVLAALPEEAPDVPEAAITTVAEPSVPPHFRQYVLNAASRAELSPRLLAALTNQESRWRAGAVSPKGAMGLTQLMPGTARELAVDARDPEANLVGGARYLRRMIDQFDGNIERALAAYNAGPGRVLRAAGIPAISETRAYVSTIVDGLGGLVLSERRK